MSRVLITGSQGYVGTRLCEILHEYGEFELKGIDSGFYADTRLDTLSDNYQTMKKDIRDLNLEDLCDIDIVVHLAAMSNDPLGEFDTDLTNEINNLATVRLAKLAKSNGCKKFIFLSTQSVYGISKLEGAVTEEGQVNPQTEYARSKLQAEISLRELNSSSFQVFILRPATVFGYSPRFRSDIVFNNLLAAAFFTEKIEILSDGSPWRPVLFIDDLVRVILHMINEDVTQLAGVPINVGLPDVNLQVRDIALAAQDCCPKAKISFSSQGSRDERTYQVDFTRLKNSVPEKVLPSVTLQIGGKSMLSKWVALQLTQKEFFGGRTVRLEKLKKLRTEGLIDSTLRFR